MYSNKDAPNMATLGNERLQQDIVAFLTSRQQTIHSALAHLVEQPILLAQAVDCILATLRSGHKILVAGNGGNAAEAEHLVAELVGRFKKERFPYAALSLVSNLSVITAIANDYDYNEIFARQILAISQPGDLLVALSTSGESENVVRATLVAKQQSMHVIAITGTSTNRLENLAHIALRIPESDTPIIQEMQMIILHLICELVEEELFKR